MLNKGLDLRCVGTYGALHARHHRCLPHLLEQAWLRLHVAMAKSTGSYGLWHCPTCTDQAGRRLAVCPLKLSSRQQLCPETEDALRNFSRQSSTCHLQPKPSLNTGVTWNLTFPVLKSQRFRVLRGPQRDLPLGGKVESSYAVLLMVRGHIPHMYASC